MHTKLLLVLFLISTGAFADIMNLNELTPTLLEDSTPVDEHSHVLLFSTRYSEDHPDELLFRPNYRYGATDRLQLEAQLDAKSGGDEKGSGQSRMAALYQLNKEEKFVPVIAINPIVFLPGGKNERGVDSQVKFLMTSTLLGSSNTPTTQVHLNFTWSNNANRRPDERRNYSQWAVGASHRASDSLAVVANIVRLEQEDVREEWNFFEIGTRLEVAKNSYLGLGLGAGMGDESPSWKGLLSFEKQL